MESGQWTSRMLNAAVSLLGMSDNRTFDDLEFFSDISECCSSELEMEEGTQY